MIKFEKREGNSKEEWRSTPAAETKCVEGSDLNIRRAAVGDAERIAEIYNWYVLHTTVTFEITAVNPSEMRSRIQRMLETHDWLVGEIAGRVIGYAYYGAFRSRAAYRRTVESSVCLSPDAIGKGLGKLLYSAAIASATEKGFCEMIGVIALPNAASVALHRTLGFQEVGVLHNVGYKFDRYIDTGIWQLSSRAPQG